MKIIRVIGIVLHIIVLICLPIGLIKHIKICMWIGYISLCFASIIMIIVGTYKRKNKLNKVTTDLKDIGINSSDSKETIITNRDDGRDNSEDKE